LVRSCSVQRRAEMLLRSPWSEVTWSATGIANRVPAVTLMPKLFGHPREFNTFNTPTRHDKLQCWALTNITFTWQNWWLSLNAANYRLDRRVFSTCIVSIDGKWLFEGKSFGYTAQIWMKTITLKLRSLCNYSSTGVDY
jgi:hypothetical protein